MPLVLIAAVNLLGVIGNDNELLWRHEEDLRRFKQITMGSSVLMGRKTWDSLPSPVRPLPGRHNIVLSRQSNQEIIPYTVFVSSVSEGVKLSQSRDLFIIGGSEIYTQTIGIAERLEITLIFNLMLGNKSFPSINSDWRLIKEDSRSMLKFQTWIRK
jgi:dihydrofolate reductase